MSKKILIVDDAAFMRMMIKDILTKNGYEVVGEAAESFSKLKLHKWGILKEHQGRNYRLWGRNYRL